jgi:hypothetical protein
MGSGSDLRRKLEGFCRRMATVAGLILAWVALRAQTYAPPAPGEFGGPGPHPVKATQLANPVYPTANGRALTVSVFHPGPEPDPARPTIFVAHGFASPVGESGSYGALLTNLASHGYNVVFSPYEGGAGLNIAMRFDQLVTGFAAAVASHGLNTRQVGFVGHSYGGGFLPAVCRHLLMGQASQFRAGQTWGGTAAFLFSMAPAYAFSGNGQTGVKESQAIVVPPNLTVVVQVFADDTAVVDPRVAVDVFYNLTTLNQQKDFITVRSDRHGTPVQVADHFLPNTGSNVPATSLQAWAIFRPLDALAAYTFTGDAAARSIALGNGSAAQTYLGAWSDQVPVEPLVVTDTPSPAAFPPSEGYSAVQWTSAVNPRGAFPLVSGPPRISQFRPEAGQMVLVVDGLLAEHRYRWQSSPDPTATAWAEGPDFTASQPRQTFMESGPEAPHQFWRLLAP